MDLKWFLDFFLKQIFTTTMTKYAETEGKSAVQNFLKHPLSSPLYQGQQLILDPNQYFYHNVFDK